MSQKREKRSVRKMVLISVVGVIGFVGFSLLLIFTTDLFLADIRPENTKPSAEARIWYQRSRKAHGGLARWKKIKRANYEMTAHFASVLMRKIIGPFATQNPRLSWEYTPQHREPLQLIARYPNKPIERYKLTKTGAQRERQGKSQQEPYRFRFFTASIRHLLDFIFEMDSADIIQDAGEATWKGQRYVRIYMTWKSAAPSLKRDQYIVWINKRTHLFERFDSTGRDVLPLLKAPFIKARGEYTNYRDIGGMKVPSNIKIYPAGSHKSIHSYTIHKASFEWGDAGKLPALRQRSTSAL